MSDQHVIPAEWGVPTEFPPAVEHADIRVRWGTLPNQTMPLEWAEMFMQIVYAEHPGVFRSVLPRLYRLPEEEPRRTRRRP